MTNEQQQEFNEFLKELKEVGKKQHDLMVTLNGTEFDEEF